ncbi:Nucleoid-associated protein [Gracilariopsis chorda]|uniref:Nucleoid-associated protein n=1 Tax=Gracilariopsis chorda TaxID=448386 RepID=A0A2V3IM76_9FLOR|nr:Nucleoid-associated protein [Gracilariopsis chorda]|eukprot:PXF43173.1 Nucleoid-associated protein [Gracilariopsis chorda]
MSARVANSMSRNVFKKALSTAGRALSSTRVEAEAGQGLVRATLAGDGRIVKLHVDSAIGKEGPKAIEELVAAAVNRAHDRLREETRKQVLQSLPPNVDPAMVLRALP